jgi:hypothetical protein
MNSTLKQKVQRKLFSLVKKAVPFRGNFRPSGISNPEEVGKKFEAQGGSYKCIYPNYRTDLVVARNMFEKLAPFTIYDSFKLNDTECTLSYSTNYEIVKIPGGRLYTNNIDCIAIITPDNKLVDRVSYQYKVDARVEASDNKIFKQRFFIRPQYVDGNVFSLLAGNGPTFNIGHWFFDAVPRIHLLKESGFFNEIDYFAVPAYVYDYQRDSLSLLGIPREKVIPGKEDLHLVAKNLFVSSHPRGNRSFLLPKWISEFLRKEYLNFAKVDPLSPKRIYISRKDSKLRRVINEEELEVLLSKHGFHTIINSKLSLVEKIKLFYNAEVIVSTSGAGLTGLFFCQTDCTVVELFPEGFVHTHYYNIAIQNSMRYFSLICKNENPAKNMVEGCLEDLFVDMGEMEKVLTKIPNL